MSTLSNKILSDIIVHTKYARYLKDLGRRETYDEICERVKAMHIKKYPVMAEGIEKAFEFVKAKKILPSMRSMQFAGPAIERNPARIYNCAYLPAEHPDAFSETMFLLLGGCGVGYSVQRRHVSKLPKVHKRLEARRRYVVGDSIEGWADAVKVLVESYFHEGRRTVTFDFGDIREKGTELVTSGGRAPGPAPLRNCLVAIESILDSAVGRQLRPIEVHDIMCHLADAVLAGGIRRAAMISLFSADDMEMMTCKSGDWWELNPQRGRANNSVVLKRDDTSYEKFVEIWERVKASGAGEPGIYWTNDYDWGTNPCCEIALRPYQFCNLVEVNVSDVTSQEDLNLRTYYAGVLATLQAGYTDFHYLRPIWKETTEEDALIGVGLTGIASGAILAYDIKGAANCVNTANSDVAPIIGVNIASRTTTIKPSGTSSIVLGCSSGIHAWHSDYYIRRVRVGKDESIYHYLVDKLPGLVEDDYFRPNTQAVISIPQEAPKGAIYRTESAFDLFERVMKFNSEWIKAGYGKGANHNNVSCTLSLKEDDWNKMGIALYNNKDNYNGMSVLPFDGGTYVQAPFEDITEEKFNSMSKYLHTIDLTEVIENEDNTNLTAEAACAGGVCEVQI